MQVQVLKVFLKVFMFGAMTVLAGLVKADEASTGIQAYYSLPIREEFKDVTTYTLDNAKLANSGTRVELSYTLPSDLIGREDETMVMLTQDDMETNTFFHLVCFRTDSEAYCTKENNQIACAVKFRNLDINETQVSRYLIDKYGQSALTSQRLGAARFFASGAIGSLTLTLPATLNQ